MIIFSFIECLVSFHLLLRVQNDERYCEKSRLSGGKREAGEFSTGWEIQGRSLGLESWGVRWKVLPPYLEGAGLGLPLSGLIGRSSCYWHFSPRHTVLFFLGLLDALPCLPYLQASLINPHSRCYPPHPPCALLLHIV